MAKAREEIMLEREDVDKDYDLMERKTKENEKKLQRLKRENDEAKQEFDNKVEQLEIDKEVII